MNKSPLHLLQAIEERKRKGLFRSLKSNLPAIDFSSNDYLGFSKKGLLEKKIKELGIDSNLTGSSGSRLISGNSKFTEELEQQIATFHNAESALIFNSGYDANSGLLSCIATKNDLILFDELIHASIYDGIRLSQARHYKFRHNDVAHLKELIDRNKDLSGAIFIVVESVYSMDGDCAPLKELVNLIEDPFNGLNEKAFLIVDEAHSIGVFGEKGRGLCSLLKIENKCFARVYTYGKAMGCHGAAILGSADLKSYLINFARTFIYTTALPIHSLFCIKAAYHLLEETEQLKELHEKIVFFNQVIKNDVTFIKSESAIHCKIYPNANKVDEIEQLSAKNEFFVKAIKSPTVKEGTERIRICLHAFNSRMEIEKLLNLIK